MVFLKDVAGFPVHLARIQIEGPHSFARTKIEISFVQHGRRGAGEETLGVILDGLIVFLQRVDRHKLGPPPAALAHGEQDPVARCDWAGTALVVEASPGMLDH